MKNTITQEKNRFIKRFDTAEEKKSVNMEISQQILLKLKHRPKTTTTTTTLLKK